MRCPDCGKFVANDEQEPEVGDIDISDGSVEVDVRIVNACADCGTELTEATLQLSDDITGPASEHKCKKIEKGEAPTFSAEETGSERTVRTEGKGRGMKTFYGAEVSYDVKCDLCDEVVHQSKMSDDVAASDMEILV